MNDFVIQFFETPEAVKCVDYNGLNDPTNFIDYLNISEGTFKVKILSNEQRREFLHPGWKTFADRMVAYFQAKHMRRFKQFASPKMVRYFMHSLSDESVNIPNGVRYGEERLEVIANIILDRIALESAKHHNWRSK